MWSFEKHNTVSHKLQTEISRNFKIHLAAYRGVHDETVLLPTNEYSGKGRRKYSDEQINPSGAVLEKSEKKKANNI